MRTAHYIPDFRSEDSDRGWLRHSRAMQGGGLGVWLEQKQYHVMERYDDVLVMLRSAIRFLSGLGLSLYDDVRSQLVGSTIIPDGNVHQNRRSIVVVPVVPENIALLGNDITKVEADLTAQLDEGGSFGAVSKLRRALPLAVEVDLLCLPGDVQEQKLKNVFATFNLVEGFNDRSEHAFDGLRSVKPYLSVHRRRETPQEAPQLMRDYMIFSLDSTPRVVAFTAYYFAKHPDQRDALPAQPDFVATAVEELVLLITSFRAFSCDGAYNTEVAGVHAPEGFRMLVIYALANRDDLYGFDMRCAMRQYPAFYHGAHICIGLYLVSRELMSEPFVCPEPKGERDTAVNDAINSFKPLPVRIHA